MKRAICLAATVVAASKCAASPGHTAQPFKPNQTAGPFLREAWSRDPLHHARQALLAICPQHAQRRGEAYVADANIVAQGLGEGDLVFVDPPYSGVHYSRFYHVLETIARGNCGAVSGIGRYPPRADRPVSKYSRKAESLQAARELLQALSASGCRVVVTFPSHMCSNGLSGRAFEDLSRRYFTVDRRVVRTRFSTLGGNSKVRDARKPARELILVLKPTSGS